MIKMVFLTTAVLLPLALAKDEWELPLGEPQLKPGPSVEVVSANCQVCHSADYISTQPPLTRASWTATVQKMREKYGAPFPTNQVEQMVEYLTRSLREEVNAAALDRDAILLHRNSFNSLAE